MPRSATGTIETTRHRAGFTLIEILVVLAIVAAIAGALVIVFPDLGERRADTESARIQGLMDLACERAAMTGRDVGIALARQRLAFGHFGEKGFEPMPEGSSEPLRRRTLADNVSLAVRVDGQSLRLGEGVPDRPQLACMASGERVPFEITVLEGRRRLWTLSAGVSGAIERERVDAI